MTNVRIVGSPDDPDAWGFDVLCVVCEETLRVHPAEPFAAQVHLFLDQHRHPEQDREPEA